MTIDKEENNQIVLHKSIEDFSKEDEEYLDTLPKQNTYGVFALISGGISFMFGPDIWLLPIITILYALVSYRTFDKNKEDNPWTFFIGIGMSLAGLYMFIIGQHHTM